jgi:predicted HNH restriction endonuclease
MKIPVSRQEQTFPLIARLISQESKRLSRSVHPTEIDEAMLLDPEGRKLVRNAENSTNKGWSPKNHASNMVAFFSKSYTDRSNPYSVDIDREGVPGSYRYRPKERARVPAAESPEANLSSTEFYKDDLDYEAIEGNPRLFCHLTRERKPELRRKKLEAEREAGRTLRCEACGFESEKAFPGLQNEIVIVEIHHRQPLAHADGPRHTGLKNLAILCPNCHRAIHRTVPMLSIKEFQTEVLKHSRKNVES